jgi:hypothetical protein
MALDMENSKKSRASGSTDEPGSDGERPTSFIGSMKGTMEILGDIISPIDVTWEADAK